MLKMIDYGDVIEFKAARTIFGRPLYYSHFFYIDGLLIDTGFAHISSEVLSALKKLPLEKVVITHQHEDHTGNCRLIQQELGVPVYAHPETIRIVNNPPWLEVYRRIMWGSHPPANPLPLLNSYKTAKYKVQTIHTPGHSPDHTCYYEPENGYLFSGDLYLGERLTGFMANENIADHFSSLEKVIKLKPVFLFDGLRGRLDKATERLESKYAYWWNICCRVKDMHEAGASRNRILKEVFGGEIFFYYFSQSNWGRRYMLDTILKNLHIFGMPIKIPLPQPGYEDLGNRAN